MCEIDAGKRAITGTHRADGYIRAPCIGVVRSTTVTVARDVGAEVARDDRSIVLAEMVHAGEIAQLTHPDRGDIIMRDLVEATPRLCVGPRPATGDARVPV